jgi:hypothetical protein
VAAGVGRTGPCRAQFDGDAHSWSASGAAQPSLRPGNLDLQRQWNRDIKVGSGGVTPLGPEQCTSSSPVRCGRQGARTRTDTPQPCSPSYPPPIWLECPANVSEHSAPTPAARCKEVPMGDQREFRSGRCDRGSARRARVRRPGRPAEPRSLSPVRRARLPLASTPRRSGPSRHLGVVGALADVIRDAMKAERVNTIGSESPEDGITIPGPNLTTPPDGHPFDPTAS